MLRRNTDRRDHGGGKLPIIKKQGRKKQGHKQDTMTKLEDTNKNFNTVFGYLGFEICLYPCILYLFDHVYFL
jgi:hypothetical protein